MPLDRELLLIENFMQQCAGAFFPAAIKSSRDGDEVTFEVTRDGKTGKLTLAVLDCTPDNLESMLNSVRDSMNADG